MSQMKNVLKTTKDEKEKCVMFWKTFSDNYGNIIEKFLAGDREKGLEAVRDINMMYIGLFCDSNVEFLCTFGTVNSLSTEKFKHQLEVYISPRLHEKSLPRMDILYNLRPRTLNNFLCCKYRPYNIGNDIPERLNYATVISDKNDEKVQDYIDISEFQFLTMINYKKDESATPKPILSIVCLLKRHILDSWFEEKEIEVVDSADSNGMLKSSNEINNEIDTKQKKKKNSGTKTKKRKYWFQKPDRLSIDVLFTALFGEYNYIHYVGYIEPVEFKVQHLEQYKSEEIFNCQQLKDKMKEIVAFYGHKECAYCGRLDWQANLMLCSRCHKVGYCSRACQIANLTCHKRICNPVK